MKFTVNYYYDADVARAIEEIARAYIERNYHNKFGQRGADSLKQVENTINEYKNQFLKRLANVPVRNYELVRRFVLGQDMAEVADIDKNSPFNNATRDEIFSHENHPSVEFFALLNMAQRGEGFTIKNPSKWEKEYEKRFPGAKKEQSERVKIAKARLAAEAAEKKAQAKEEARLAKERKAAAKRELKDFMKRLKKSDRARYDKLTKLHKIEKKQNSRISSLQSKLEESRRIIAQYAELKDASGLTKSEMKKLVLAEKNQRAAALQLATEKATIQSQLRLLVTEGVITDDYAVVRADQIENVDFTYSVLDKWGDACRAGQLPERFKYTITSNDSIESLRQNEHSLTVEDALDDLRVEIEDKMEIYDAQRASDKEVQKTRKEITEARYQRYMQNLKKRNPDAHKALTVAHSITDREDAIYEGLKESVMAAEREVAKCNYMIDEGKLQVGCAESREANLKLEVARGDLENQELNIKMSKDIYYGNGVFSQTFKCMRQRQVETGDFTFRPMDTPEAAVSSGQLPCELVGKNAQEVKTWVRAQIVNYAYEVPVNPTKVNFAELGIELGPKSREQHERDFEKVVEHARTEATVETTVETPEQTAVLTTEDDELVKIHVHTNEPYR